MTNQERLNAAVSDLWGELNEVAAFWELTPPESLSVLRVAEHRLATAISGDEELEE